MVEGVVIMIAGLACFAIGWMAKDKFGGDKCWCGRKITRSCRK